MHMSINNGGKTSMNTLKGGVRLKSYPSLNPEYYSVGDNWETPIISGYDILYEHIIDDLERFPYLYQDWEVELIEKDSLSLSCDDKKRLQEYIEDWLYAKSDEGF